MLFRADGDVITSPAHQGLDVAKKLRKILNPPAVPVPGNSISQNAEISRAQHESYGEAYNNIPSPRLAAREKKWEPYVEAYGITISPRLGWQRERTKHHSKC